MHRHKIGRFLITFGVTLVVYAMFFMRISVDGNIVNLSLLSNRQNMVIIGALAVIAGLILRYASGSTSTDLSEPKSPEIGASPKAPLDFQKVRDRSIRWLKLSLFLLVPYGAYLQYFYLFHPSGEISNGIVYLGLALYFGPIIVNRRSARIISTTMIEWKFIGTLLVLSAILLIGILLFFNIFLPL